jgi:hypothetical protein
MRIFQGEFFRMDFGGGFWLEELGRRDLEGGLWSRILDGGIWRVDFGGGF